MNDGWIGVDLDGTLAEWRGWCGPEEIGPPIPSMVERVQGWLAEGIDVRIFTARVGDPADEHITRPAIARWCLRHIGIVLPITCQKDLACAQIWDDRAVQVMPNEGAPVNDLMSEYLRRQKEWSERTFGEGRRTKGITAHIRKELDEIEAAPLDLEEWIDVIILAADGFWRAGGLPEHLMTALFTKQGKNFQRAWPPPQSEDLPTEHIRDDEGRETIGHCRRCAKGRVLDAAGYCFACR